MSYIYVAFVLVFSNPIGLDDPVTGGLTEQNISQIKQQ